MGINGQYPKSLMGWRAWEPEGWEHIPHLSRHPVHKYRTSMHKDQSDQGVWKSHRSSVFLSPALCIPQVPSTARNTHGTGIKLKIPARKTILNSSSDITPLNKKSRRNHSTSQPDSQHKRDEGVPPPPILNDTDKEIGKSRRIQRLFLHQDQTCTESGKAGSCQDEMC